MDLDLVRIRLYIEKPNEKAGLFYGKKRVRISDDIWMETIFSWEKATENHNQAWKQVYKHDQANSSKDWYALDINKFAVLT
jgi:hypothetical protein